MTACCLLLRVPSVVLGRYLDYRTDDPVVAWARRKCKTMQTTYTEVPRCDVGGKAIVFVTGLCDASVLIRVVNSVVFSSVAS